MMTVCLFLTHNLLRKHEQVTYSPLKVKSSGSFACYCNFADPQASELPILTYLTVSKT
jgi:hypothetical protein